MARVFIHQGGWGSLGQAWSSGWGGGARAGGWGDRAKRAGWIAAGVVVLLPLVALMLAAAVVGAAVFVIYGLLSRVLTGLGAGRRAETGADARQSDDGRRNVTVIERDG